MDRLTKSFPTFDCDAHVNDPVEIWDYVPESQKDLVKGSYWRDGASVLINGDVRFPAYPKGAYNPLTIAGPQMNKKIIRKLTELLPYTDEQVEYLDHKGAYDPHARIKEMDLMGIDQVLIIGSSVINNIQAVENDEGLRVFCDAYNRWLRDWCDEVPGRLYGAAILPITNRENAVAEIQHVAELGHPVALMRPIVARGGYPHPPAIGQFADMTASMDNVFRAFEDTGVCLGMHTFPAQARSRARLSGEFASANGYLMAAEFDVQTLGFIVEAQVWLAQVLLSGFLDRYPRLKMLIFESNSQWLPYLLEYCDRLFELYRNERQVPATRLPSEAFAEQCAISFEGDEEPTFRQWRQFEDIGVWSSDVYHHDAADAWSAIRTMRELEVPDEVQAKLLGANACRFYGVEQKLFVTEEPPALERPSWFPQGPEFDEWASLVVHPRENAEELRRRGWDAASGRQRMATAQTAGGAR